MLKAQLIIIFSFSFLMLMGQNKPMIVLKEDQPEYVAGTEYKALVYLVNVKTENAEYVFSDEIRGVYEQVIPKDSSGAGILRFWVTGGAYDKNGKVKKRIEITAKYKENGKVVSVTQDFTCLIRKPNVSFEIKSKSILYKKCDNNVKLLCSDFGNSFNPAYESTGAKIIKNTDLDKFSMIPYNDSCFLNVIYNGSLVISKKFYAIIPPIPVVKLFSDSIELGIDNTIPTNSKISVSITPELSFVSNYPKDARYRLDSWTVSVLRNNKVFTKKEIQGQKINLSAIGLSLVSDDILVFEIKDITRMNFMNEDSKVFVNKTFMVRIM
jgi:hypothetical protein